MEIKIPGPGGEPINVSPDVAAEVMCFGFAYLDSDAAYKELYKHTHGCNWNQTVIVSAPHPAGSAHHLAGVNNSEASLLVPACN